MGRRRVIGPASRRSAGPARAFLLTLAVGLLVGLLLGFFLGRIVGGGGREQAAPPVPPARTVRIEETVRAPEKTIEKTVRAPEKAVPATTATTSATASASASP
jgi:hypothetical protein